MKHRLIPILCLLLLLCSCGSEAEMTTPCETTEASEITVMTEPPAAETSVVAATDEATVGEDSEDIDTEKYFDGAVFVGDSIMEGIRQYVVRTRKVQPTLGEARFVATTVGISLADLVGDKAQPNYYRYNGKEQPIEDILSSLDGIDKVFLLLGQNDLVSVAEPSFDVITERYLRLVCNLQTLLPDAEIIIMTNPPKVASSWLPNYVENRSFDNSLIDAFVESVKEMCTDNEIRVFDMHSCLENEDGILPDGYCRDGYIHLSDEGAQTVVNALYEFAKNKGEAK